MPALNGAKRGFNCAMRLACRETSRISAGYYNTITDEGGYTTAAHLVGCALPGLEVSAIDVHLVLIP